MFDPERVRVVGPLTPFVRGFWAELVRRGYTPLSGAKHIYLLANVSSWLQRRRLGPAALTSERVCQFVAHRRRAGRKHLNTERALVPLLDYLRSVGAVRSPARKPRVTRLDSVVARYTEYLVHQRGLAPGTIRSYCDFARRFLAKLGPAWRRLGPADVIHSVESEFRRRSVSYCKHKVGELRALLRYLYVDGQLSLDLAPCVPAVAGWRLASLPQALEPEQVTRLLSGCRRGTVAGCRDRAILCLLSRLGLRAGEVAALQLEDIDWRGGELLIRGKGHSDGRLPLPRDVGQAVAAYLRKRPRVETRALFLCARAPHRPIGGHVVSDLARKGLRAIGVGSGSAHRLRHTAATQMLRAGASLSEISHVLRHRHLDTTAIYAKVDDASLRTLARPWPGGLR